VGTTEKFSAGADFDVVLVLTTIGADADAVALGRTLVDERLAACVNVLPTMTSVYRWQGRIEEDHERQIVIKTARRRVAALERRLRQLHPYELPEFLVLSVSDGSEGYLRWVGECTSPEAGSG
jgi:periplasmic divalent cation tolerance protein